MSPFRNSKGVSRVFTTTTNLQVQVGQLMLTQGTTHRVYASPPRPSLSFSITYDDAAPIARMRQHHDSAVIFQMMM